MRASVSKLNVVQIQCFLQYLVTRASLRRDVFVDFVIPLSTKTYGCETILGKSLSRNGLKSIGFRWECREKSKKHHAIALAALGGCGGLGQRWEALGELWECLEKLWKSSGRLSLYIQTPDQPHQRPLC